jgi:hypothetical protein
MSDCLFKTVSDPASPGCWSQMGILSPLASSSPRSQNRPATISTAVAIEGLPERPGPRRDAARSGRGHHRTAWHGESRPGCHICFDIVKKPCGTPLIVAPPSTVDFSVPFTSNIRCQPGWSSSKLQ